MPFPPSPADLPFFHSARDKPPLRGLTILAVEDSRFACDALRLLCQRSGARLRRAESLVVARAHLRVYRPDVVLIDLGLPDGRGEELIRLIRLEPDLSTLVLAMSGDPAGRTSAMEAGAMGFIDKPIAGLAAFQTALLAHLPQAEMPSSADPDDRPVADPLALQDDLKRAALALTDGPGPDQLVYLSGFLGGIARQTEDRALAEASEALRAPHAKTDPIALMIGARLRRADQTSHFSQSLTR